MKINYTDYCKASKIKETDINKKSAMFEALKAVLIKLKIKGKIEATYYTDGCVKVTLNGEYYNMFDSVSKKFFEGAIGDYCA